LYWLGRDGEASFLLRRESLEVPTIQTDPENKVDVGILTVALMTSLLSSLEIHFKFRTFKL